MADIADSEAAFIEWISGDPNITWEISSDNDLDTEFIRIYRSGGTTDPGTKLDHPQLVVSVFGGASPSETPKHAVATMALDALARALDMKGKTVAGCVCTYVEVANGLQAIPEPNKRRHYQFAVNLTTHPAKE